MSDDFKVERYSTRIDRIGGLIRKADATRNPLYEELAEAWIDLLDSIIEDKQGYSETVNNLYALLVENLRADGHNV